MDVSKLREVFDLCDENNENKVLPERIIELARQANSGDNDEAMNRLESALDGFGTKPINFEEFYSAIKSIEKIDHCDANNLVRKMSITYQNINGADDNTKYLLDDSSTTYNEYDYNNMAYDDIRESVLSNTIDESFENYQRTTTDVDFHKYPKSIQDNAVYELEDKVNMLKLQINTISDEKTSQHDRLLLLQKENNDLRNRLIVMEERLQDVEMFATSSSSGRTNNDDARQAFQDFMSKYESTFIDDRDTLLQRVTKIEKDLEKTKEENQELKENLIILQNRPNYLKSQHSIEIDEKYAKLKYEHDEMMRMYNEQCERLKESQEKLRDYHMISSEQSIQQDHSSLQNFDKSGSLSDIIRDLQDNIAILNEDNKKLKKENADLSNQLEVYTLKEKLIFDDTPWATELDMMSKEELQSKVQDLLTENIRYRQYVENINTKILLKYPDLLEKSQSIR